MFSPAVLQEFPDVWRNDLQYLTKEMTHMSFIAVCGMVAVLVVVYCVFQQPRKPFVIGLLIGGGLGAAIVAERGS